MLLFQSIVLKKAIKNSAISVFAKSFAWYELIIVGNRSIDGTVKVGQKLLDAVGLVLQDRSRIVSNYTPTWKSPISETRAWSLLGHMEILISFSLGMNLQMK